MAIVRWSPFTLSRWPNIWDEDEFPSLTRASNNLDVYETADEVVVKANVAGVDPAEVDLTYEKGVLWIKADKMEETQDESKKHYSKSSWSYSYKVAVPGAIDHSKEPQAEVDNGVLTVRFSKTESSKPKKLSVKAKGKQQ